jgi:acetolactate synthase regulatory subunit
VITTKKLFLELDDSADAIVRVLMVLRRRRCRVLSVEFVAGDRHYEGRLEIGVAAPAAHAHCVESWLGQLVDVRRVESAGAGRSTGTRL